jgi:hypothetical protein
MLRNTRDSPMAACKSSSLSNHWAYTLLRPCSGSILHTHDQEGTVDGQHSQISTKTHVTAVRTGPCLAGLP